MDATTTAVYTDMIDSLVADIGSVLQSGLPTVLGLVAILIGLFFVYYFVKRQISQGR